jgi:hypothetical protein
MISVITISVSAARANPDMRVKTPTRASTALGPVQPAENVFNLDIISTSWVSKIRAALPTDNLSS